MEIIVYFGLQFPLLINKDFMVISGNQILKVLKYLDYETVPCIITNVTKEKEWQLYLALDRIHGDWLVFRLQKLFKEKNLTDKELSILGFSLPEISSLANLDKFKKSEMEIKDNTQSTLF